MAEEAKGNGQSEMPPMAPEAAQQLIINAQYIKDLSFENPRAPQSLIQQNAQPSVDINVDVKGAEPRARCLRGHPDNQRDRAHPG